VISRHWKGIVKPGQAEAYIDHLKSATFPKLASIPGFLSASILRREVEAGTEFQIVTVWDSLDAIRSFAGPKADVAVVPAGVQALMSAYDPHVVHYEVTEAYVPR
jgi:heme-degrading monooxygenase HmoA